MTSWNRNTKIPFWKKYLPLWMQGMLVLFAQLFVFGLIGLMAVGFCYFLLASKYDLSEVAKLPEKAKFYDRHGRELEISASEGRKLVSREEIPDFFVKALLAREDARFYEHHGLDYLGLFRAVFRNLKDRDFTQGASTLSMQLARNTYQMRAKSLHRKALEIALTMRIEARYTKDEILTSYLNRIYFGSGAYGLEQAAQTYFGKTSSELLPGECALIAGIIRGPHIYSPFRNFEASLEQRNQTLTRMEVENWITKKARKEIESRKIELRTSKPRIIHASYSVRRIRAELEAILERENFNQSGMKVFTTLDHSWQKKLEAEILLALRKIEKNQPNTNEDGGLDALQVAAISLDTKTSGILAYMGGRSFHDSKYDRTQSKRDLGGAFEPFISAAVAERGKLALPGRPVQTGRQLGAQEVIRIAKRCGIDGMFLETEDLFRGGVASSATELATALATIGNSGSKNAPFIISHLVDADGKTIYQSKQNSDKVISNQASKEALKVLQEGFGSRYLISSTTSLRDTWVLRVGKTGATVIWIGYDQPKSLPNEEEIRELLEEMLHGLSK